MPEINASAVDDKNEQREAPTITKLGTLAELTLGGVVGADDGLGGGGPSESSV